jgi:transcriptional regulator with XRE-family HTH domain
MAKFKLKIEARKLRKKGISVNEIAKKLNISKSTASAWVRDIILTVEQLEKLRKSSIKGAELGRLRSAFLQKEKRLRLITENKRLGIKSLKNLTKREFLVSGLGIYWGEGSKKSNEFSFCNSDPEMVKFFIHWLKICFRINTKDLICSIGINESHRKREQIVKKYWLKTLRVKENQFTKTSFKKTKNKKVYENFNSHYGTIRIRVRKPGLLYNKVIGFIEGLKVNMPG